MKNSPPKKAKCCCKLTDFWKWESMDAQPGLALILLQARNKKKPPKPETKPLLKYKAKGIKQMQNHLKNLPMYWFHGLDTLLSSWLCSRSPKPAFFPLPHSVSEVQPGDARAGQLREQGLRMLHRWSRPEFSFYSNTGVSFLKRKKKECKYHKIIQVQTEKSLSALLPQFVYSAFLKASPQCGIFHC